MRFAATLLFIACVALSSFAKQPAQPAQSEPYYPFVQHHALVQFDKETSTARIEELAALAGGRIGNYSELLDFYRIELNQDRVKEALAFLRKQPEVVWANYNYIARAMYVPNDQFYQYQWHYPLIGLEQAWDITRGSADVVVAVLDQGWQFDHEDFTGVQTVSPYDFIDNDANPSEPTLDDSHGMHTAGTIFAATNNTTGIAGIAPLCRLMPVRVLDNEGSGSSEAIANGFAWAAQQGAEVINASLGFPNPENQPPVDPGQPLSGAVQQCGNAGVVMAVSSGNDNADYVSYPAAYTPCIAVGASTFNNERAPYSNMGTELDVTAPGGNTDEDLNQDGYIDGVLSTVRAASQGGDYYAFWQGTSMAAPHVAGIAALIMSNGCPANQVRNALQNTALDLGAAGWDPVFGWGVINAQQALQYDCSGGGGETVLFSGPVESDGEGWSGDENGADGIGWTTVAGSNADCGNQPHGGANAFWHDDEQNVGMQDDWLYTTVIEIPANATNIRLTFWQRNCYVPAYYVEHGLYFVVLGNEPGLIGEMNTSQQTWQELSVNADALAGESVYFAWRYRGDYATEWFLDDVRLTANIGTDAREADLTIPERFTLGQPYPNPFNSVVQIPFELSVPQDVSITIHNVLGQKVATLGDHLQYQSGAHTVTWQADASASGVFFVRFESGKQTDTRKILLLK